MSLLSSRLAWRSLVGSDKGYGGGGNERFHFLLPQVGVSLRSEAGRARLGSMSDRGKERVRWSEMPESNTGEENKPCEMEIHAHKNNGKDP